MHVEVNYLSESRRDMNDARSLVTSFLHSNLLMMKDLKQNSLRRTRILHQQTNATIDTDVSRPFHPISVGPGVNHWLYAAEMCHSD